MDQVDPPFCFRNDTAAILVMEHGSLWPGRSLDWAGHVSVVLQPARRSTDSTLRRVRRAVDARAVRSRSLECVAVTFADVADPASFRRRSDLVNGLGAILAEIGCQRLILAAHHAERLDLAELIRLVYLPSAEAVQRLHMEVSFQRASNLRCRRVRARR
jgi:hypothetical protein